MRHFISILLLLCAGIAQAQTAREDIKANPYHAGDTYTAYIAPSKPLTAAPKGYEPFYMSHYGRHGSRYLIGYSRYTEPLEILTKAHEAGKLTPRGEKLLEQFRVINADVDGRQEELTPLGAQQHRDIAQRMYERFPTIFGGKARIDAKSSTVIRCILSMSNELMTLRSNNPKLDVSMDASAHDMYYINQRDHSKGKHDKPRKSVADSVYHAFADNLFSPTRVMNVIFNSEEYWKENIKDPYRFVEYDIWGVALDMQSTELRKEMTLLDLFTNDELYNIWLKKNADWYLGYSASPLNGGQKIYRQRNLIKNIIHEADSCIALGTENSGMENKQTSPTGGLGEAWHGATMRFGHEVVVLPTVCFMNLNGAGMPYTDFNDLVKNHWYNYRFFCMASNIQLIFYKPSTVPAASPAATATVPAASPAVSAPVPAASPAGTILVKILLNEEEATISDLKPVTGPYYKWSDIKSLWEKKLAAYKE